MKERPWNRDLFAQLPTNLIHTILSFLITPKERRFSDERFMDTKEATRTIVLSKTFLQAWSSCPDLYFTDFAFSKSLQCSTNANQIQASNARERFANYVLHTITTYQYHNIPIVRLNLTARVQEDDLNLRRLLFGRTSPSMGKGGKIANILDQSIRKACEYRVKEVYLHISFIHPSNFLQTIFALKPLVSLILNRCDLVKKDSDIFINCSSLRVLKLDNVRINEAVLQKLIHSCMLIEEIQIYSCKGIEAIQVANLPNLKSLQVSTLNNQIVDVKAASLEFMIYDQNYRLHIESAQSLKIMTMESATFTGEQFHNLIANCAVLEELTLHNCDVLENINVSSRSRSFLSIMCCRHLVEVKIDAPFLNMFEYYGERVLSPLSFASGGSEKRKSSVTLYLSDDGPEEVPSFLELSVFLMTLKPSDNISLDISSTEISFDRNILDGLRGENNIPEFDEVHITVSSPSSTYSALKEGLLWSFSPNIISVKHDSKHDEEFVMYLCEKLLVQHDCKRQLSHIF